MYSILLALSLLLSGCATIMSGSTQEMSFQSSPDEAVVTMVSRVLGQGQDAVWHDEMRILGKTPLTVQLDREDGRSVVFSKTGYAPVTMKLATTTNGYFWGNIVCCGLVGSTTDSMSGAINEYSLSQFFVTLTPDSGSKIEDSTLTSQREKAREFMVRRYTSLMADLGKGRGEDLASLMGLLKIDSAQESDAHQKIRALSQVYQDAAVFATHVAELYLK